MKHGRPSSRVGTRGEVSVPRFPFASARLLIAAAFFGAFAFPARLSAQAIVEFPLAAGSSPAGITSGPDGDVWFVEEHGDRVGRIAPSGALTEFPLPAPGRFARGITAGPDGALWFTELTGRIGRVTPAGSLTELAIPTRPAEPISIVTGSDGNLWYTDFYDKIGRVTPSGALTSAALPAGVGARAIAAGPDGNLWFTEANVGRIGRMTPAMVLTEFRLPDAASGPFGITAGPDGNLWFTEFSTSRIGRITPSGALSEFSLPGGSGPYAIAAGSDGNLWFTESSRDRIGRMTPAGVLTEFPLPPSSAGASPTEITSGPDGNIWFSEFAGDRIGRVSVQPSCSPDGATLCLNAARFRVQIDWSVTDGTSGAGHALPLTGDTGAFWFFTQNNLEVIVKVVDGRPVNGQFWVFIGSLSNVEYVVTVRDLVTGMMKSYENPQGTLRSIADTAAF